MGVLAACAAQPRMLDGSGPAAALAEQMTSQGYACGDLASYAAQDLPLPRFASDGAKCSAESGPLWIVTFADNQARDAFRTSFAVGRSSGIVYAYGDRWIIEAGSRAALRPAAHALGTEVLPVNSS